MARRAAGLTLAQLQRPVRAGRAAPVPHGTPAAVAATITHVSHNAFVSGMHTAFLVAAVVALTGAVLALLTKRGDGAEGAHAGI
jgi:hypothetical protein